MTEPTSPISLALRLIGVPRVELDARPIALGSRKAVALLVLLALDGTSARARLAALLWPDQDETSARRNLRREVFRLRNAGVPIDDGETQSLALAVVPRCDALEPGGGGRGILLDGFDQLAGEAYAEWLASWRARLAQRGQRSVALAAAEHEKRGDWRAALALYLSELDDDPTNESAAQHALRMHAHLHERDAALALFARLESQLRLQLGLSPLPATRELLQRFGAVRDAPSPTLAESASGIARASGPTPLPARAPFSGRSAERLHVQAALQAGRTVFVSGPPGIGKSRLAAECAATVGASLFASCRPDDAQLAYSSAVRTLRALLDAAPDLELPEWVTRELTRLLPELGPPAEGGEASEPAGDEARLRLFEAYAQAWLLLAEGNFNVIVLDDWQFADTASLQLWSFIDARGPMTSTAQAPAPVGRLYAFRSGELPPMSLAHLRRQVDSGHATLLALDGLSLTEVQSLVQRLAGQSGAELFAQRLHGATGGNPLFVMETLRHLFERQLLTIDPGGGWRTPFDEITSDYAELPVPPSARETLLARVHALGDDAARMLQAASLAGDTFDLALLAGTSALSEADSVTALERAQASQILRVGDDGSYRFAHDLYRQGVADSLSPARRMLLHGRLARNLAAAAGAAAPIARHFERAQLGREAAPWFVRAGADAARVFDFESALEHYRRALQFGLSAGDAYEVRDRRLLLLHRLHRTDEQLQELALMAELARDTDNPAAPHELAIKRAITLINSGQVADAVAQARWVAAAAPTRRLEVRARYTLGVALMYLGDDDNAVSELEAALAQAPEALPNWEPLICAFLCHLAVSGGALEAAQRHHERGLRAGAALNLPLAQADVLNAGYRMAEAAGERELAIERLERANALSIGVGDVTLRINYLFNLITVHLNGGDTEAARGRRTEVMALLVGKTDPKSRFIEKLSAGRLAMRDGELGRAWHELQAGYEAAVAAGDPSMQRSALIARAHLAADCGQAELLDELLDALVGIGPHPADRSVWIEQALRARLELAAGDPKAAAARLTRACAMPRLADPDWQEHGELTQVMLASALAADGRFDAAREALHRPRFSARLKAMAAEVGLAIAAGDDVSRRDDRTDEVAQAEALLADGGLAPLEAARLWRSIAAYHLRRRCTQSAARADANGARLIDALAATLPTDDAATARLRSALNSLRPL
ncbi:AAA family ATPase [Ideonella sp. A 288]|uniref:ATP-binding protein n=1 Tax=Ideonella sp. A 288 TaxID=1962181 RepID=UPI0013039FD4|nr:AAA family ATPase [Ideonella sp. A 288]